RSRAAHYSRAQRGAPAGPAQATTSISTIASRGSRATCTAVRAGGREGKKGASFGGTSSERTEVGVPPADDDADPFSFADRDRAGQERRQRRSAARLRHEP